MYTDKNIQDFADTFHFTNGLNTGDFIVYGTSIPLKENYPSNNTMGDGSFEFSKNFQRPTMNIMKELSKLSSSSLEKSTPRIYVYTLQDNIKHLLPKPKDNFDNTTKSKNLFINCNGNVEFKGIDPKSHIKHMITFDLDPMTMYPLLKLSKYHGNGIYHKTTPQLTREPMNNNVHKLIRKYNNDSENSFIEWIGDKDARNQFYQLYDMKSNPKATTLILLSTMNKTGTVKGYAGFHMNKRKNKKRRRRNYEHKMHSIIVYEKSNDGKTIHLYGAVTPKGMLKPVFKDMMLNELGNTGQVDKVIYPKDLQYVMEDIDDKLEFEKLNDYWAASKGLIKKFSPTLSTMKLQEPLSERTLTYVVTVKSDGKENHYYLDGEKEPELVIIGGDIIKFQMQNVPRVHPFFIGTSPPNNQDGDDTPYRGKDLFRSEEDRLSSIRLIVNPKATDNELSIFRTNRTTPTTLYYRCDNHIWMGSKITIIDGIMFLMLEHIDDTVVYTKSVSIGDIDSANNAVNRLVSNLNKWIIYMRVKLIPFYKKIGMSMESMEEFLKTWKNTFLEHTLAVKDLIDGTFFDRAMIVKMTEKEAKLFTEKSLNKVLENLKKIQTLWKTVIFITTGQSMDGMLGKSIDQGWLDHVLCTDQYIKNIKGGDNNLIKTSIRKCRMFGEKLAQSFIAVLHPDNFEIKMNNEYKSIKAIENELYLIRTYNDYIGELRQIELENSNTMDDDLITLINELELESSNFDQIISDQLITIKKWGKNISRLRLKNLQPTLIDGKTISEIYNKALDEGKRFIMESTDGEKIRTLFNQLVDESNKYKRFLTSELEKLDTQYRGRVEFMKQKYEKTKPKQKSWEVLFSPITLLEKQNLQQQIDGIILRVNRLLQRKTLQKSNRIYLQNVLSDMEIITTMNKITKIKNAITVTLKSGEFNWSQAFDYVSRLGSGFGSISRIELEETGETKTKINMLLNEFRSVRAKALQFKFSSEAKRDIREMDIIIKLLKMHQNLYDNDDLQDKTLQGEWNALLNIYSDKYSVNDQVIVKTISSNIQVEYFMDQVKEKEIGCNLMYSTGIAKSKLDNIAKKTQLMLKRNQELLNSHTKLKTHLNRINSMVVSGYMVLNQKSNPVNVKKSYINTLTTELETTLNEYEVKLKDVKKHLGIEANLYQGSKQRMKESEFIPPPETTLVDILDDINERNIKATESFSKLVKNDKELISLFKLLSLELKETLLSSVIEELKLPLKNPDRIVRKSINEAIFIQYTLSGKPIKRDVLLSDFNRISIEIQNDIIETLVGQEDGYELNDPKLLDNLGNYIDWLMVKSNKESGFFDMDIESRIKKNDKDSDSDSDLSDDSESSNSGDSSDYSDSESESDDDPKPIGGNLSRKNGFLLIIDELKEKAGATYIDSLINLFDAFEGDDNHTYINWFLHRLEKKSEDNDGDNKFERIMDYVKKNPKDVLSILLSVGFKLFVLLFGVDKKFIAVFDNQSLERQSVLLSEFHDEVIDLSKQKVDSIKMAPQIEERLNRTLNKKVLILPDGFEFDKKVAKPTRKKLNIRPIIKVKKLPQESIKKIIEFRKEREDAFDKVINGITDVAGISAKVILKLLKQLSFKAKDELSNRFDDLVEKDDDISKPDMLEIIYDSVFKDILPFGKQIKSMYLEGFRRLAPIVKVRLIKMIDNLLEFSFKKAESLTDRKRKLQANRLLKKTLFTAIAFIKKKETTGIRKKRRNQLIQKLKVAKEFLSYARLTEEEQEAIEYLETLDIEELTKLIKNNEELKDMIDIESAKFEFDSEPIGDIVIEESDSDDDEDEFDEDDFSDDEDEDEDEDEDDVKSTKKKEEPEESLDDIIAELDELADLTIDNDSGKQQTTKDKKKQEKKTKKQENGEDEDEGEDNEEEIISTMIYGPQHLIGASLSGHRISKLTFMHNENEIGNSFLHEFGHIVYHGGSAKTDKDVEIDDLHNELNTKIMELKIPKIKLKLKVPKFLKRKKKTPAQKAAAASKKRRKKEEKRRKKLAKKKRNEEKKRKKAIKKKASKEKKKIKSAEKKRKKDIKKKKKKELRTKKDIEKKRKRQFVKKTKQINKLRKKEDNRRRIVKKKPIIRTREQPISQEELEEEDTTTPIRRRKTSITRRRKTSVNRRRTQPIEEDKPEEDDDFEDDEEEFESNDEDDEDDEEGDEFEEDDEDFDNNGEDDSVPDDLDDLLNL